MKPPNARRRSRTSRPTSCKTELEALLKEQFGLRMQKATQQLTNTSKLTDVRRDIARVRTLMHQKAEDRHERQDQNERPQQTRPPRRHASAA